MNADQFTLTEKQKSNIAVLAGKVSPEEFIANLVANSMKQRENIWAMRQFQAASEEVRQAVIDLLK
jgi:hypothetical protein